MARKNHAFFDLSPRRGAPRARFRLDKNRIARQPISRVLCPLLGDDYSSRRPVAKPLKQPTRVCSGRNTPAPCCHEARHAYLVLLPVRFAVPFLSPETRWALTPPFHPYPIAQAVCSLWHCLWGRPRWALPTTASYGARTFLPTSLFELRRALRPA